jgi:hypothetical protein
VHVLRAIKFLFVGPIVVLLLFAVNLFTSPGQWWFQWAALGIAIAWVASLFRVLRAVLVMGGLAALVAYVLDRQQRGAGGFGTR